jgi:ERF superfamily
MSDIAKLAVALVKAQSAIKAVAKDSRNAHANYQYASAEDVIDEARKCLNDAGIAVLAMQTVVAPARVASSLTGYETKDGTKVTVQYLVLHESGESFTATSETAVVPEKGRPQDKAEATALTYNLSYFMRGLLLIPRGTDADSPDQRNDNPKDDKRDVKATPAKAAPATTHRPLPDFVAAVNAATTMDELKALKLEGGKYPPQFHDAIRKELTEKYHRLAASEHEQVG